MRQETIAHIKERMAHAEKTHGPFVSYTATLAALRLELAEAQYAADWQTDERFVAELLDIAVVAIRAAEQLS